MSATTAIRIEGEGGITVRQDGAVAWVSGTGITSGSVQFLPTVTKTTSSVLAVPFDSRQFVMEDAGDVVIDLLYELFIQDIVPGVGDFMGGQWNLFLDGVSLASTTVGGVYEIDLDPAATEVVTEFLAVAQKAVALNLAEGTHTLAITWQAWSTGCLLSVDANKAILQVRLI